MSTSVAADFHRVEHAKVPIILRNRSAVGYTEPPVNWHLQADVLIELSISRNASGSGKVEASSRTGSGLHGHAHEVVLDAADSRSLEPMAEAAKTVLGADTFNVVAGAGYSNAERAANCEAKGIFSCVPANRTIKDATVKRYFYDSHHQLKTHLSNFIAAYNFARQLKTLRGLTPYEYICKVWAQEPDRFTLDPTHLTLGPYS